MEVTIGSGGIRSDWSKSEQANKRVRGAGKADRSEQKERGIRRGRKEDVCSTLRLLFRYGKQNSEVRCTVNWS